MQTASSSSSGLRPAEIAIMWYMMETIAYSPNTMVEPGMAKLYCANIDIIMMKIILELTLLNSTIARKKQMKMDCCVEQR